jgi:hypothetical protein
MQLPCTSLVIDMSHAPVGGRSVASQQIFSDSKTEFELRTCSLAG